MKKVFAIGLLFIAFNAYVYSQNYERNGKQFTVTKQDETKIQDKATGYTWKDSKGNVYDIYISKKGSCYIIKTSKKTGKPYRQYLPKEVSNQIAEELGMSKEIDYE